MADPVAAVRAILLADTATAALVATNVFSGDIPDGTSMPQPAVVVNPSGGPRNPGGGLQRYGVTRTDVFCYGATPGAAWQVYLAVYAALKHAPAQTAAGTLVQSIDVLSKGALGTDPLTQWPVCIASFAVLAAE